MKAALVFLNTVMMIAAGMTPTMSIELGSISTPSSGKCLSDDQLGKLHPVALYYNIDRVVGTHGT